MRRQLCFAFLFVLTTDAFTNCTSDSGTSQDASTDGTVEANALDSGGKDSSLDAAEAGVTVKVTQPTADASFSNGDQVALVANAADSHGAPLTDPLHLVWTTNVVIDPVGEGSPASFQITGADAGAYKIRATATDDAGNSAFDEVGINVIK